MRQLYYTIRYLLRGRGGNVIKVLSLTLGLGVGLILFARVAFELSFDTFFDQVEDLYSVHVRYNDDKTGEEDESRILFAPIPEALRQEFPEIQYATVCRRRYGAVLYHGEDRFKPRLMMADSLFFRTMGIKVLRGDDRLLGIEDQVFLSEKMAERIFGKEDPIGKQLLYGKNYPYTVAGIFRDIPENSHLRFDAVASFINMKTQFGAYAGWGADDSYLGYIRLKPGVFPEQINQKIPALLPKYIDVERERKQGFEMELYIKPVSEIYTQSTEVKRMVVIMSVLAFALLFVAAMNYILNSVSSLPIRARSVGVHKCNGASSKDIFNMFLFETAALFVVALVCMALLLFAFREYVADMAAVPTLGTLLNAQTIWLPAIMILAIFILSALLPARLFSVIPVTQVFRVSTSGKQGWKRSLLFIQFGGIAFVITLLVIVLLQYDRLMNNDLGYDPENIVYAPLNNMDDPETAKLTAEFKKLPYVTATGLSSMDILSGYGGFPILDNEKNWLFTARQVNYDADYLSLMKIPLLEGQPLKGDGDILVNESFVSKRGWTDGAIGKYIYDDEGNLKGMPVVVVQCGVGKVNAAMCVQILADLYDVTHIINTGVAGSLNPVLDIGDILVSKDAIQHDMDVTPLGYTKGQIPGLEQLAFVADEKLCKTAVEVCKKVNPDIHVTEGRVVSGDQFISSKEIKDALIAEFHPDCTEMEGASIAQAATLNNIPYVVIRAISDKADGSAQEDYPTFEKKAAEHCAKLVQEMMKEL